MKYVYVLVGPVHAPVRGHRVEADVVERVVVLLHVQLCQVAVSVEHKDICSVSSTVCSRYSQRACLYDQTYLNVDEATGVCVRIKVEGGFL